MIPPPLGKVELLLMKSRIPFGGVKQSGIGRELGEAGLAAYTNSKAVHVTLQSAL